MSDVKQLRLRFIQCDQIGTIIVQNLTIYNNEIQSIACTKAGLNSFEKHYMNPQKIATVANFSTNIVTLAFIA